MIDEVKYNRLFLEKFQANKSQLDSEFKRIIEQYGYTEEIKLAFYTAVFKTLIKQFKKDLPKNDNYAHIIINSYTIFIKALKEDDINTTEFENDLNLFVNEETPKNVKISKPKHHTVFIPEDKQYNLNTKYGRRKAREQAARNYQNGTPEYKRQIDNMRIVAYIIIAIILVICYLVKKST